METSIGKKFLAWALETGKQTLSSKVMDDVVIKKNLKQKLRGLSLVTDLNTHLHALGGDCFTGMR